jgi:long-subunit acyl-CoA synthetase (AMP-forming)
VAKRDNGAINNEHWFEQFNNKKLNLLNIYASTEVSNILTTSKPEDVNFPNAAGRIENSDIDLKILNKELLVKSKYNLLGYYVSGNLVKATDDNGYFHTNDEFEEKDGRWYVHGRILNFSPERQKLNPTYKNDAIHPYNQDEEE